MSYSITVRAATAALALAAIAQKFDDEVVKQQPVHAVDREAALAAAERQAALLGPQPEGQEVRVSLSGSIGWRGTLAADNSLGDAVVTASATNASVYYEVPPTA